LVGPQLEWQPDMAKLSRRFRRKLRRKQRLFHCLIIWQADPARKLFPSRDDWHHASSGS
jgi:hypothetical protein